MCSFVLCGFRKVPFLDLTLELEKRRQRGNEAKGLSLAPPVQRSSSSVPASLSQSRSVHVSRRGATQPCCCQHYLMRKMFPSVVDSPPRRTRILPSLFIYSSRNLPLDVSLTTGGCDLVRGMKAGIEAAFLDSIIVFGNFFFFLNAKTGALRF